LVHEFWSSHAAPSSGTGSPAQVPFVQASSAVQALPSSHTVPSGLKPSDGHAAAAPVHVSAMSHALAAARQTVPAATKPSAGQALLAPSQLSATSQAPAAGRQTAVLFASAGQVALDPVQVSATSHAPAAARHTVALEANWQEAVQQEPGVPFPAPRSQSSPGSVVPSPQAAPGLSGTAPMDHACAWPSVHDLVTDEAPGPGLPAPSALPPPLPVLRLHRWVCPGPAAAELPSPLVASVSITTCPLALETVTDGEAFDPLADAN